MNTIIAIIIGKLIRQVSRILKIGGGSAAPGLYALRADPFLIQNLTKRIPINIIVTGTNGKTTTSKLIAHFLKTANKKIIHNATGSNLERGIASTLLSHVNLFGKLSKVDIGIWELDEAAFNHVAPKLSPKIVILLNAFRDQLDRYGEVNHVVKNWEHTFKSLKNNPTFIINIDDSNTQDLSEKIKGNQVKFGLSDKKITGEKNKVKKIAADFEASKIVKNDLSDIKFEIKNAGKIFKVTLPIPGIYHIYDFLAAFATGCQLGIDPKLMIENLNTFSPAFGRMEKIQLGKNKGYIFLIKNPVGATQVFETINPDIKPHDRLLIALNDNHADGTDVSWIWDAEFEKLHETGYRGHVIISGTRAYDLALRLKYAGFDPNHLELEPNLTKAFTKAKNGLKGSLFILPTYTAMLNLQHILTKLGLKKDYWEEN